jgi:asparagine synthase (glutamine-hydrolysing)
MSVLFGKWNFDGMPIEATEIERTNAAVAAYAPDDHALHCESGLCIGYRAFHTTAHSRKDKQPHATRSGVVITWDGRLDNRDELVESLQDDVDRSLPDIELIAAAYARWNLAAFAKLVGDWSLVIWDPRQRRIILASDFVASRRLYYQRDQKGITWSTVLDPLVRYPDSKLTLSEDYIAGWLSGFPAAPLTPYREIRAVPPSAYLIVTPKNDVSRIYWIFDPKHRTKYRSDREYEQHFLSVFRQAVRRRLSADRPVLAELSGGMDSSSIVCLGHEILNRGEAEAPRLDTISYFTHAEPAWNDRPYFTKVEEKLGRQGHHIRVADSAPLELDPPSNHPAFTPAAALRLAGPGDHFADCVRAQGNRVLLSGIGGDEALGGVPTAIPELADLLVSGQLRKLLVQAIAWGVAQRKPLLLLFLDALQMVFHGDLNPNRNQTSITWLRSGFGPGYCTAPEPSFQMPRPSFRENLRALDLLRRQLALLPLSSSPLIEKRYPYLDRDLLEYLYSIPREQMVRPTQRRSLMRRALAGLVPEEILNRKRKAFVVRAPLSAVSECWAQLTATDTPLISEALGFVDRARFSEAVRAFREGAEMPLLPLSRAVILELWLRQMRASGMLAQACSRA